MIAIAHPIPEYEPMDIISNSDCESDCEPDCEPECESSVVPPPEPEQEPEPDEEPEPELPLIAYDSPDYYRLCEVYASENINGYIDKLIEYRLDLKVLIHFYKKALQNTDKRYLQALIRHGTPLPKSERMNLLYFACWHDSMVNFVTLFRQGIVPTNQEEIANLRNMLARAGHGQSYWVLNFQQFMSDCIVSQD